MTTPFSIEKIANFFDSRTEFLKRGEDHIFGNTITVRELVKDNNKIYGQVDPGRGSTKNKSTDKSYKVEICYNDDGPTSDSCTCPIGKLRCSHMAALLLWAQKLYSKTDFTQTWSRPSLKNLPKETQISQLWKPSKTRATLSSPINKSDRDFLRDRCNQQEQFGLHFLLSPQVHKPTIPNFLRSIEDLASDEEFTTAVDKVDWLFSKIVLNETQVSEIARLTEGQSNNPLWLSYRKYRITASVFGSVLSKIKCNSYPPSFWKSLFGAYNLDNVQSIIYGKAHEKDGVDYFKTVTGFDVSSSGIVMHVNGDLGASPDGLVVGQLAIIEVKCPFSQRNSSLQSALNDNNFCLYLDDNNQCQLKKSHNYYAQVQGTMYLTKYKYCYFIVWTPNWEVISLVDRDPDWGQNMSLLHDFYKTIYLPQLMGHLKK